MREEMIITEADLASRFQGERDLITYSPYRIGDRVVRCSGCRAVIKSEYVSNNRCPLCGRTPFLPAPVNPTQQGVISSGNIRSLTTFLWLLVLSIIAVYIPFVFPGAIGFLYEASFEIGLGPMLISIGIISLIAAIILYFNRRTRWLWQNSGWGGFLVFVPVSAPYSLLAALWLVVFALAIAAVIACIALVIGIIACFFE